MIVGFNHNVLYLGVGFHVQTEDGGLKSPNLVTLLYHGGIIVSSQKTSYADILKVDNLNQVVEDLAKEQHKGMLRRLTKGTFDKRIGELGIKIETGSPAQDCATPAGETTDSAQPVNIDEVLLEVTEADIETPASEELNAEPSVVAGVAEDEPLLAEEIEELEPVPLELPVVGADEQQFEDHDAAEPASTIEPTVEPQSVSDVVAPPDASGALDDLILAYLTGGDEKS